MRISTVLLMALMLTSTALTAAESPPGKLKGGVVYSLPSWFKPSFLDFQNEIEEARTHGKQLMLFMHLDECPYCAKMLEESFTSGELKEFMEAHFEVIGVNVRGSLELTWVDGTHYVEQELADHLRVIATPTLVFLDPDGNEVLQLNGYRDPPALRYAVDYVQAKRYLGESFTDYLKTAHKQAVYEFRSHPQFTNATYLKGYDKPLAILFEDRYCAKCNRFHDRTLNHPDVIDAMKPFLFVRLDAESNRPLVTLDGSMTTPARWVETLGLTYRPSVVLFNEGREMFRADGGLYHEHFTEALRYVSEGYKQYDTLSEFKTAYREERMRNGFDIDFSE